MEWTEVYSIFKHVGAVFFSSFNFYHSLIYVSNDAAIFFFVRIGRHQINVVMVVFIACYRYCYGRIMRRAERVARYLRADHFNNTA